MKVGYIQETKHLDEMKGLGIDENNIFLGKVRYQDMKQLLSKGDLLYIDALSSLGKDYGTIIQEWKSITNNIGADIVVLDDVVLFDSRKFKSGKTGKSLEDQFIRLLNYVAEQDKAKKRRQQKEGIEKALAEGRNYGRPKIPITREFIAAYGKWKTGKITAVKAMQLANMTPNTFYRKVKQYETEKNNKL